MLASRGRRGECLPASAGPSSSATLRGVPEPGDPARRLPHVAPPVIPATDLGGVTVLKRAGVFLLTNPFGDPVPDSRGLGFTSPTRVGMMACLVLLVGGKRPSVLQPDPGGADRGTIALTNPDLRRECLRQRVAGATAGPPLAGDHPGAPAGRRPARPASCRWSSAPDPAGRANHRGSPGTLQIPA